MSQIRCPNCGNRFDPQGLDFCPNPDCGFPLDFMEPEDDSPPEDILRRPGERVEPAGRGDDTDELPPVAPPPSEEAPTERIVDEPIREQPRPTPPPPPSPPPPAPDAGPVETPRRGFPTLAVVLGALAAVLVIAVVAFALTDRETDVAVDDGEVAPTPDPPVDEDPGEEPAPDDGAGEEEEEQPDPPNGEEPVATIDVNVFFVDAANVQAGEQPFVRPVPRAIPHPEEDPRVARNTLAALFEGPTPEEAADNLQLVTSGATGLADLSVAEGIFTLRLTGGCDDGGLPVTIADQLIPTLKQFATVDFVKILDPDGDTLQPDGPTDSIPACLAP